MIKLNHWVFSSAILLGSMILTGCGTSGRPVAMAPRHHSQAVSPSTSASAPTPSSSRVTSSPSPASSTSTVSASSPSPSYVLYHNRIWGYSLSVPKRFIASPSPEDGDGKSWRSGGTTITVYGQYSNTTGHTETAASALTALDHQKHPSYQAHGSDWLVVSGTQDDQIYYIKEFIGTAKNNILSISYPAADQNYWNSMVNTVSRSFTPGGLSNLAPASIPFQTERVTVQPGSTVQLDVPSGWKKQNWHGGDTAGVTWVNPLNSTQWVRLLYSGNAGALWNNQDHYDVTDFVNSPGVQWRVVQSNQLSGQFTIPIGEISTGGMSSIGITNLNKYVDYGYAEIITRPSPLGVEIDAVAPKNVAKVISTSVIIR